VLNLIELCSYIYSNLYIYLCHKVRIVKYATKRQYFFAVIVKKQNIVPSSIEISIGLNTNSNAKLSKTKKTDKCKKLPIKTEWIYVKNTSKDTIIKYMTNVS
jgi:hypothetical protein